MRVKMNGQTVFNFQDLLFYKEARPPNYNCTACEALIKHTFNAYIHPLIECLICKACYAKLSFARDDDRNPKDPYGDYNFCLWCCDEEELFVCMTDDNGEGKPCRYSFCRDCIVRNVPDDPVRSYYHLNPEAKAEFKWTCYVCNPQRLSALRQEAQLATEHLDKKYYLKYTEPSIDKLRYDPSRPELVRRWRPPPRIGSPEWPSYGQLDIAGSECHSSQESFATGDNQENLLPGNLSKSGQLSLDQRLNGMFQELEQYKRVASKKMATNCDPSSPKRDLPPEPPFEGGSSPSEGLELIDPIFSSPETESPVASAAEKVLDTVELAKK